MDCEVYGCMTLSWSSSVTAWLLRSLFLGVGLAPSRHIYTCPDNLVPTLLEVSQSAPLHFPESGLHTEGSYLETQAQSVSEERQEANPWTPGFLLVTVLLLSLQIYERKKKNVFFSMKIIVTISTLTTSLHIDPVCVFGDSINMTKQRGLRHINNTESVAHITADLTILSRSLRTSDSKLHCLLPFIITKYTWKHHLFKNNGEPQGQTVIQTLWFLEWFCAQPSAEKHLAWMV